MRRDRRTGEGKWEDVSYRVVMVMGGAWGSPVGLVCTRGSGHLATRTLRRRRRACDRSRQSAREAGRSSGGSGVGGGAVGVGCRAVSV